MRSTTEVYVARAMVKRQKLRMASLEQRKPRFGRRDSSIRMADVIRAFPGDARFWTPRRIDKHWATFQE